MKKVLIKFIVLLIMLFLFNGKVVAKEVNVYVFYGKTCPHCEEALEYLNKIKNKYDLNIIKYEVWFDAINDQKMKDIANYLDVNASGVPFVIIDNTPIFGYSSGVTDDTYKYHIKLAKRKDFKDKVGIKLGVVNESLTEETYNDTQKKAYELSIFQDRNINFENINIYLSSIILGLIDSVNPSMLWIFIVLFALLLDCKNEKKKIILSVILLLSLNISYTFLINSGSFDKSISYVSLSRLLLSVILICFGTLKLILYANCLDEKTSVKENKIKNFLKNNSLLILSIIMIIFGVLFSLIKVASVSDASILFSDLLKLNGSVNKVLAISLYALFSFAINIVILMVLLLLVKLFNKTKIYKLSKLISGILFFMIGIFTLVN